MISPVQNFFNIPEELDTFLIMLCHQKICPSVETIVGDANPEEVVMLEIEPEKQTTYIDFLCTHAKLGD